jgi:hypothetical protein
MITIGYEVNVGLLRCLSAVVFCSAEVEVFNIEGDYKDIQAFALWELMNLCDNCMRLQALKSSVMECICVRLGFGL